MKRERIASVLVLAAAVLSAPPALATPPVECSSGPDLRNYEETYQRTVRNIEELFEVRYGCSALPEFLNKVHSMSFAIEYFCPAKGYEDAKRDTIARIAAQCLGAGRGPGRSAARR